MTAVDMDASEGADAMQTQLSGKVMVVTPDNRSEIRKVQLGLETSSRVEIRSGLQEGDLVVIGNRAGLQPGQQCVPSSRRSESRHRPHVAKRPASPDPS